MVVGGDIVPMGGDTFYEKSDEYRLYPGQKLDYIYSDQESGTTSSRAGYSKLCSEIEQGRICQVFVYRLDRLGRDPIELIRFFNLLEDQQVNFISLTEPWLTDWNKGPMQFMSWWMQVGMARFELLLLKDRQRRGIDNKKAKIEKGLDTWNGRGKDKKPRQFVHR